jgi:hypothetical protein
VKQFVFFASLAVAVTGPFAAGAQVPMPLPRPPIGGANPWAAPKPEPRAASAASTVSIARPAPGSRETQSTAAKGTQQAEEPDSPCTELLAEGIATAELVASVSGTSGGEFCGDEAPVRLTSIKLRDGSSVELQPAAVARCEMALAFARWVRDDVAPAATHFDGRLQRVEIAASYSCRPRNNIKGAKMSEHGLANAIDVGAIVLSKAGRVGISGPVRPAMLFAEMRRTACERFTTVLGPGSDAAHEHHLHLDLAKRRGGYRMCQWIQYDPIP